MSFCVNKVKTNKQLHNIKTQIIHNEKTVYVNIKSTKDTNILIKMAWTSEILYKWLHNINAEMISQNRKILLLM